MDDEHFTCESYDVDITNSNNTQDYRAIILYSPKIQNPFTPPKYERVLFHWKTR